MWVVSESCHYYVCTAAPGAFPCRGDLCTSLMLNKAASGVHAQVMRARKVGRRRMQDYFQAVERLPALVITGAKDRCSADLASLLPALRSSALLRY